MRKRVVYKAALAILLAFTLAVTSRIPVAKSVVDISFEMQVKKSVITVGEEVELELTLRNIGDDPFTLIYPPPLFDAYYYDGAGRCFRWSDDKAFITIILELTLAPGEAHTETLRWNMYQYDIYSGTYTLPEPGTYELFARSIVGSAGPATITINPVRTCDFNSDHKVDLADLIIFAQTYGSKSGDPNWNESADLAEPRNIIGLSDLVTFTFYYGQTY